MTSHSTSSSALHDSDDDRYSMNSNVILHTNPMTSTAPAFNLPITGVDFLNHCRRDLSAPMHKIKYYLILLVTLLVSSWCFLQLWFSTMEDVFQGTVKPISTRIQPIQQFPYFLVESPYNKTCSFEVNNAVPEGSEDVSIYYHIGLIGNWKNIVMDQLDTLERCGLGYIAKNLVISHFDGNRSSTAEDTVQKIVQLLDPYPFAKQLQVKFIPASGEPYEWLIMQEMREMCLLHSSSRNTGTPTSEEESVVAASTTQMNVKTTTPIVFYFHNKGSSRWSSTWKPVANDEYFNVLMWRKFMEFFLQERPTLCLRAILRHGAMACGVHVQEWPSTHYSGNFWAASCPWISQLNNHKPEGPIKTYIAAELWIGNQTEWTNKTEFLELFSLGLGREMILLNEITIVPENYTSILTNRSLWPESQIPIWSDYLSGLKSNDR